jgi:general secretion pathway protein D
MLRRLSSLLLLALASLCLTGCPKGNDEFSQGKKAEILQDFDTAVVHYQRALRADPINSEYKLRLTHARFEAGQFHVQQGQKALKRGEIEMAVAEFQKATTIDPSNDAAAQGLQKALDLAAVANAAAAPPPVKKPDPISNLMSAPPELKPLSREPINLKMTNEARIVFETIAKLAGLTAIFDPDFTSRRISIELPNVTLEQALDAVALESKSFWKPMTSNIILVAPDLPQKRADLEDEIVRTFYLSNTITPQDLTEIVTGLRQLLDLKRVQQVNAQNAIVIRDTPDKLLLAQKIIQDIDKAKPEVVLQVQVLQARLDRIRDLGIEPGGSAVLAFTPRSSLSPNSGSSSSSSSSTTTPSQVTLQNLKRISSADYSLTLPGATANALLSDSNTKIIQNPEIRVTDGQVAKLRIGDRVPIATGSFQAGVGVGVSGGAGVVNPLVNTQFTYIDVGVNIDVTPRVHPDNEVSMKLKVEVSSVSGTRSIGGIDQPVISQRTIEHDIRLKEGEVNILGGLIERGQTKNLAGWPGLQKIPFFRYFFSNEHTELTENEVLILLTPRIVRYPAITAENLRTLAAGADRNVRVYREDEQAIPARPQVQTPPPAAQAPPAQTPAAPAPNTAQVRFEPGNVSLKAGDTTTIGVVVDNVQDLFSIPILLQYNPAVIQVEEVRQGGFLEGGTQQIAIVQRVDQQRGQAIISATRQPNTPGVNGSGTLLGIIVRAVAPGTSTIQVLQVNARDSQQKPIPLSTGQATVTVQ